MILSMCVVVWCACIHMKKLSVFRVWCLGRGTHRKKLCGFSKLLIFISVFDCNTSFTKHRAGARAQRNETRSKGKEGVRGARERSCVPRNQ